MELWRSLKYTLSLPERTLRSVSAAVGGVSRLLTDSLLPASLRGTTFYQVFLGNTQRFLAESIGEVKAAGATPVPDDFLARKVAGNVADAAGLFAFHFSPLWFFALVADGASGTKLYLQRVVEELKKDGALAPDATIGSAEDLLEALSGAARKTALPIDVPPLTRKDLEALRAELAQGYGEVLRSGRAALPSPQVLWDSLLELRKKEAVPFLTMSGVLALSGARAAGLAGGKLFYERVVLSYAESLEAVRREGFAAFFAREARPYLEAIGGAFSPDRTTFTERLLSGRLWTNRRGHGENKGDGKGI